MRTKEATIWTRRWSVWNRLASHHRNTSQSCHWNVIRAHPRLLPILNWLNTRKSTAKIVTSAWCAIDGFRSGTFWMLIKKATRGPKTTSVPCARNGTPVKAISTVTFARSIVKNDDTSAQLARKPFHNCPHFGSINSSTLQSDSLAVMFAMVNSKRKFTSNYIRNGTCRLSIDHRSGRHLRRRHIDLHRKCAFAPSAESNSIALHCFEVTNSEEFCHLIFKNSKFFQVFLFEISLLYFLFVFLSLNLRRSHSHEKKYECNICKKRFSFQQTLRNHMFVHTSEKRFKCDTCNMSFRQIGHLQGIHVASIIFATKYVDKDE